MQVLRLNGMRMCRWWNSAVEKLFIYVGGNKARTTTRCAVNHSVSRAASSTVEHRVEPDTRHCDIGEQNLQTSHLPTSGDYRKQHGGQQDWRLLKSRGYLRWTANPAHFWTVVIVAGNKLLAMKSTRDERRAKMNVSFKAALYKKLQRIAGNPYGLKKRVEESNAWEALSP